MPFSISTTIIGLGVGLAALLGHRLFEVRRLLRTVPPGIQGDVLLFDPTTRLPLPDIKWISRSQSWNLSTKHSRHAAAGSDIIYRAVLFPSAKLTFQLADPVSIKHVGAQRHIFIASPSDIEILKAFGDPNILGSEGEIHRRLRRAIAPAFSDRQNELVWDEAIRVVDELVKTDEWSGDKPISVPHIVDLTEKMALHVITSCGFGQQWSWDESKTAVPSNGHRLTFNETILLVAQSPWVKVLLPRWLGRMRKAWDNVFVAYDELRLNVGNIMAERRSENKQQERFDLLSGLMSAAEKDPDDKMRITEDEMYSNCVVALIAGHETTAHSLAFVLGELAANPEVQARLHQHIIDNLPGHGAMPTYKDAHRFPLVLATVHETLRLYPVAGNIPRLATQDTIVPTADPNFSLNIQAGSLMEFNVTSMHYNPKYWADPLKFNPERFLEADCNKNAFATFSTGPRMCIGKRFAEVEMISLIIGLLTRYKIELPNTPEWNKERYSQEQLRTKLLNPTYGLTYAPKSCPLVFVPRT